MLSSRMRLIPVVVTVGAALTMSACTKVTPTASPTAPTSNTGATSNAPTSSGDAPVAGGVLKVVGSEDFVPFDFITPSTATAGILRGVARQLVSYRSGPEFSSVVGGVVADVATEVPQPENGTTYTFTLRDGVVWDLATPRPVTAGDFARGIKRLCNPVAGGYHASYFAETIEGMGEFCDGFGKLGEKAKAGALKKYIESNDVAGLTAKDDKTLVVNLNAPAGDFLNMMALTAASAVPVESLSYLPGSDGFRKNFVSNGPYKVDSYSAGKALSFVRNPNWTAESDPLRKAYVDEIEIELGLDEGQAQTQIEEGNADYAANLFVPTTTLATASGDPRLHSATDGSNQYVAINVNSNSAKGALKNPAVRQALNVATDKTAVIQVNGGPDAAAPLNTILTPQVLGYKPSEAYKTPDDAGDPDAAKKLLADAGYADGVKLRLFYAEGGKGGDMAQALQESWKKAGITVELKGMDRSTLGPLVIDPKSRKSGWDLVIAPAWTPDWYGNAARTFFVPLISSKGADQFGTSNYGGYANAEVDKLIEEAIAEADANKAADIWAKADELAMKDAPWVPLFTSKLSFYQSERLQDWAWNGTGFPDYTNMWLDPDQA